MPIRLAYTISVALACGLAILAAFLPWTSLNVEVPIFGSIGTITRYGYEGDGIITLLLALPAAGFVAYLWFDRGATAFRLVTLFNSSVGAVVLATALVNLFDSQRALGNAQQQLGVDLNAFLGIDLDSLMETGEGVYVSAAAGAILAVASILAFSAHRFAPAVHDVTKAGEERPEQALACNGCGTPSPSGANYCLNCGRRLP